MKRFGIFCPPAIGHLNPMCVIGLELQRRGHEVVFFGVPDALLKIENLGFTLCEIGAIEYPRGSIDLAYKTLGKLTGKEGLKFTLELLRREAQMLFSEAPQAIKAAKIDVLIIDQITLPMATVANFLGVPFITICNALPVNREPTIPPFSTHWTYSTTWFATLRNRFGNWLIDFITRDLWKRIVEQRHKWQLSPYKSRNDVYSTILQLCQLPSALDFPRQNLPTNFHYIGQFQDLSGIEPITFNNSSFPFEKLDGRPLIYASLGTLQNQRPEIFECIANACLNMNVQLVISLGNPNAECVNLAGNPIVVPFAPHQKIIERSQLVITHAGMNTVLTALSCGVPIVAIPITNEQPGIAERLKRTKAGEAIQLKNLNEKMLRDVITKVLTQTNYRENAQRMKQNILEAGGVVRAVDIIEESLNA